MNIGLFVNGMISFMIVAFAVFLLIKGINKLKREEEAAPEAAKEPTTKECPHCLSTIAIKATRCPNCTNNID